MARGVAIGIFCAYLPMPMESLFSAFLLGEGNVSFSEITAEVLFDQIFALWLGCIIFGLTLLIAGYFMALVIRRWRIIQRWKNHHPPTALVLSILLRSL